MVANAAQPHQAFHAPPMPAGMMPVPGMMGQMMGMPPMGMNYMGGMMPHMGFQQQQQRPGGGDSYQRGGGGGHRNGHRGAARKDYTQLPPMPPAKTTLTLYHVPWDICTPEALMGHFRRFGTVVRIKCSAHDERAHVMFEDENAMEAALASTTWVCRNPSIKVQMSMYDIVPLRDDVKAKFNNDYAHFFYDVDDPSTHFEMRGVDGHASTRGGLGEQEESYAAEREKFQWKNSEVAKDAMADEHMVGGEAESAEALNAKARQLQEVITARKKALVLMEERKKIEEKMLKIEERRKAALRDHERNNEVDEEELLEEEIA